jgi:hypothetical protein
MKCSAIPSNSGAAIAVEVYLNQKRFKLATPTYEVTVVQKEFGSQIGKPTNYTFKKLEIVNNVTVRFFDDNLSGDSSDNIFEWNQSKKMAGFGDRPQSYGSYSSELTAPLSFCACKPSSSQTLQERAWNMCKALGYEGQDAKCKPKCLDSGVEWDLKLGVDGRTCKIGPTGPRMG